MRGGDSDRYTGHFIYIIIILQIFQFPHICDYHDAIYAVTILDEVLDRRVYRTHDIVYDGDGSQNIEVEVRYGMEINRLYTAVINVTTAVKSTTTDFVFSKHLIIIIMITVASTTSIISGTSIQTGNLTPGIVTESS